MATEVVAEQPWVPITLDSDIVAARQQGVGFADVTDRISTHNDRSDEHQFPFSTPIVHDQFSLHSRAFRCCGLAPPEGACASPE